MILLVDPFVRFLSSFDSHSFSPHAESSLCCFGYISIFRLTNRLELPVLSDKLSNDWTLKCPLYIDCFQLCPYVVSVFPFLRSAILQGLDHLSLCLSDRKQNTQVSCIFFPQKRATSCIYYQLVDYHLRSYLSPNFRVRSLGKNDEK